MSKTLRLINVFVVSCGFLLFLTAFAKFFSAAGHAGILHEPDPIFSITFRHLFYAVGCVELSLSIICLLGDCLELRLLFLASLSTCFVIYRIGMNWINYHRPCPCLGTLTETLHVSPQTADTAMKYISAFIVIGSYCSLYWLWKQRRQFGVSIETK
jgi:hypothetical protein